MTKPPFEECDNCGAEFELDERYPVSVREAPEGGVKLYSFCDRSCQRAWAARARGSVEVE